MNSRQSILLSTIAALLTLGLIACGGGSSPAPPPAVTVSLSGQPASLTAGATASITATVSNGTGVTWSATCATAPCGTFSATTTPSGSPTTYTAPAAPTSVTITATPTSGTAASATISITAPVIAVTFTPAAPASINAGATSPLTAVVTNDSKNAGVTWKVTCGSPACGSFNPASTASGTATTYTAPSTVPTPNTVTVTATSVTDTTKSATATITIGAPPPILADGNYVYHFSGSDNTGSSFVAGAITVKSGAITAGEQDFRDAVTHSSDQLVPANSGLSLAGNNIQIVLATANANIGVNGVFTLHGTIVSTTRALISEFDTFGTGTGSIDLQTSTAAPSGGYAFALSGLDLGSPNVPLVLGGILHITGTSIATDTTSVFDFNVNGTVGQAEAFSAGSVSAPDSFGRIIISLTPATVASQFILAGFIVGPNQIQLVESQTDTLNDDLGGMALGQGTNTGAFTQASISGKTYVYAGSGTDSDTNSSGLVTIGGTFTFTPNATVTGNMSFSDGVLVGTNPLSAGSYAVDPTGRVTLSGINVTNTGTGFGFQLYLDGNGNALEIGVDTLQTTEGPAYLQATTTADFEGNYALQGEGFLNATNVPAWGAVGPVTVASDAFTGFTDYTAQTTTTGATATANQAVTGTETNSTAMLSLTGLDSTALTTARAYSYFPIDSRRVLAIEVDGQQLGILTLEGISH